MLFGAAVVKSSCVVVVVSVKVQTTSSMISHRGLVSESALAYGALVGRMIIVAKDIDEDVMGGTHCRMSLIT